MASNSSSSFHYESQSRFWAANLVAVLLLTQVVYRKLFKYFQKTAIAAAMKADGTSTATPGDEGGAEPLLARKEGGIKWESLVRKVSPFLSHHVFVLLFITYILLEEMQTAYAMLAETDWLRSEGILRAFANEPDLPGWWNNELQHMLADESNFLRYFSLSAPVFMLGTFLVTCWNMKRHLQYVVSHGGIFSDNPGVQDALLIIQLPLVACLMAFTGVIQMWNIVSNSKRDGLGHIVDFHGKKSWEGRLVTCQNYYAAGFFVTDVFESFVLLRFMDLTFRVVRSQRWLNSKAEPQRTWRTLKSVLIQGIYLFVFTCFLEATYSIGTNAVEAYFVGDAVVRFVENVRSVKESVDHFFLGMGTIASTAAIGNLVTLSLSFSEELENFKAEPKFWSTKVLVSLAFVQTLILYIPPLSRLSITEKNLAYATAIVLECFFLSLWHLHAWETGDPNDDEQTFAMPPPPPDHLSNVNGYVSWAELSLWATSMHTTTPPQGNRECPAATPTNQPQWVQSAQVHASTKRSLDVDDNGKAKYTWYKVLKEWKKWGGDISLSGSRAE